jgi:hypothetical protein
MMGAEMAKKSGNKRKGEGWRGLKPEEGGGRGLKRARRIKKGDDDIPNRISISTGSHLPPSCPRPSQ